MLVAFLAMTFLFGGATLVARIIGLCALDFAPPLSC